MGQHRRNDTDEYKVAAVERLYEPGATQGRVAKELGITGTQLKPNGGSKRTRRNWPDFAKRTNA